MTRIKEGLAAANAHAFQATGEMARLCGELDWAATPLGPAEQWPRSLRTVVNLLLTSRFAMWMGWGPDLAFLYNDAYRPTLGVKHPWALAKPAREVWAEIWPEIGPRIRSVLESGVATWDEALLLFLERSGYPEETYHTFSYSPLTDDNGDIAGMFCVVTEETDRVIGERRLGSLRDLASALAASSTERDVFEAVEASFSRNMKDLPFSLVYRFDDNGEKATLVATTGLQPADDAAPEEIDCRAANGWPLADVFASNRRVVLDDLESRFALLPSGGWDKPPRQAILVAIAQQAHDTPAAVLIAGVNPYRQLTQDYWGFVELLGGQISASLANARAFEEEKRRVEALAELDRAKTAFFSNVSHEFRTPLTLLLGPIENALAKPNAFTDAALRTELELAHRNGLRLLRLVNTMLDFSRIEAGRVDAVYEPTDLSDFTAELASAFRSACDRAGLTLTVDAAPLPAPVFVDHDMWEKIVLNLLSNAFKHTFEGGISVRVRADANHAILEVTDTGVGIPPEELPRIFERFHRVSNARSRTHEGTGIGLALVQELVRRHGGDIDVESAEGVGTTFRVSVPFGSAHLSAERISTHGAVRQLSSTALGAMPYVAEATRWLPEMREPLIPGIAQERVARETGVILVADDNADMRDYVTRLLEAEGWTVDAVPDGAAAVDRARARRPDLVLSDVMMPRLDGFGVVSALRSDPATASLPIVLLSARAGEEARVEGAQAGADDYLVKPFSAAELIARVSAHVKLSRQRELAMAEARAARDLVVAMIEQAPVAMCLLRGPHHEYDIANSHYLRLVGNRDIIGRTVGDALPEVVSQGFVGLLDKVYSTGEPYTGREVAVELDVTGAGDLDIVYLNFVYQPFKEADGTVTGVIVAANDVTDQVRARHETDAAREEAERARQAAESANRAKSQFLAVMSHELRTPLNAIAGYAQLLEMGLHGPLTDQQRHSLERINRSQRHLLSLINDVLNLTKIETGRVEYDIRPLNTHTLLEEVKPLVEPQFESKGVTFEVQEPDGDLTIEADADKVMQILLNLLSNAVKFTAAGGSVTLTARTQANGDVAILVSDTGTGIPESKLESIFEPFVQVNTVHTRTTEGAGLGLAISRDLARGMGGALRAASVEGKGSTFTLVLPRVR